MNRDQYSSVNIISYTHLVHGINSPPVIQQQSVNAVHVGRELNKMVK